MANTVVNVNISVSSVEELRNVLKAINGTNGEEEDFAGDVLERAKAIALDCVEHFIPFTYDDVGLPSEKRNYRTPLREWAEANNVEYRRVKGIAGVPGALFVPFRVDESGKKIYAEYPTEG